MPDKSYLPEPNAQAKIANSNHKNSNPNGLKKIKLFSQATNSSIYLAFLDVKLWLKEGDYQILKYSLKFTYLMSESLNFFSLSHYFRFNIARLVLPIDLGSTIIRLFIPKF